MSMPCTFQNTNPERGRKQVAQHAVVLVNRISEHKPRKGTETISNLSRSWFICSNFRTQTPKGDGNLALCRLARYAEIADFRTQTPKGDGNAEALESL